MLSTTVLVLDECEVGRCESFESLTRWLSACFSAVRFASFDGEITAGASADVVLVHACDRQRAEAARSQLAQVLPGAHGFVVAHRGTALHECVPNALVDELVAALGDRLGRHRAFQILPGVVGCSTSLCKAGREVRFMAGSDAICLLQGETGTGKELFARAIHYLSARENHPFVPLNCGAVPDQLFENELFGHARGAFTDAKSDHLGLLAHAEHGTLFLDEVDCLSPLAQIKLLRVLQEREYRPVGSAKSLKADVRIIAASNADLRARVDQRLFREDLFHRLNVLRLSIPPLRQRSGDIPVIARYFVREFSHHYQREVPSITADAYAAIEAYPWPGNVREMQAMIERAVLLCRAGTIAAGDLEIPSSPPTASELNMKAAKDNAIRAFERGYLSELLSRYNGNISQAARVAGKERRSFQRLLRKHDLSGASFRD